MPACVAVAPGSPQVFGHSATTLYKLDPQSNAVCVVGNFDCPSADGSSIANMFNIAISQDGTMYGTTDASLVKLDATNAHCTQTIQQDAYPRSLSFVPTGILDPNSEILVGYKDSTYFRIDPQSGVMSSIGDLNAGAAAGATQWVSSGDIVSIKGDSDTVKTFMTVHDPSAGDDASDSLAEVDAKTGAITSIVGTTTTGFAHVWGLGYWDGYAYGFTKEGKLIQISLIYGKGVELPIAGAPSDLSFVGGGVTTLAPVGTPKLDYALPRTSAKAWVSRSK